MFSAGVPQAELRLEPSAMAASRFIESFRRAARHGSESVGVGGRRRQSSRYRGTLQSGAAQLRLCGIRKPLTGERKIAAQQRLSARGVKLSRLGSFTKSVGELPGGAVAQQPFHQSSVHGVARALSDDPTLDATSSQREVADQVEHLVPDELIVEAQRPV